MRLTTLFSERPNAPGSLLGDAVQSLGANPMRLCSISKITSWPCMKLAPSVHGLLAGSVFWRVILNGQEPVLQFLLLGVDGSM
jgi:hypothetical protein